MSYTETLLFKEILEQGTILKDLQKDSEAAMLQIADKLKNKEIKQIVVVARGSSGYACDYFAYLAEICTKYSVKVVQPSVVTVYDGLIALDNSLVVGVSQSGMAQDVLCCLERAKLNNSIVVSVTNSLDSPIAKVADVHLYCNAGLEKSVAATKSFSSSMFLLMLLVRQLSDSPLLKSAPDNIVRGVNQTLQNQQAISQYAMQNFVDTKDAFVLARGLNFAIAKETALKFSETSYIKALAFSVAEFQHGPYAMVDENATIVAFAPSGKMQVEMLKMVQKSRGDGAKVTVVSTEDSDNISPDIKVPNGNDVETPFFNIVVSQIMANAIASAKGLRVDNPRGLNKVTITK